MRLKGVAVWAFLMLGVAQSQSLNGVRELIEMGDLVAARTQLQVLLDRDPQGVGRVLLARVFYLQGNPNQALVELKKVPVAQWSAEAFWVRGLSLADLGKNGEALADLKAAGYLGNTYQYMMDWGTTAWRFGKLEVAKEAFGFAEALEPNQPWPFLNMGMVLYSLKQHGEALQHLQQGVEVLEKSGVALTHPAFPELYYWLGQTYEALNDRAAARSMYQQVLAMDPDYTAAASALAALRK